MSARRLAPLALVVALLWPAAGGAVNPDERLDDPALEARARELSQELRCLVCQNQSIDDSDADLARDLRILVRQRLVAGDSDAEVLAFVTERYGDYVLLRPPVQPNTYVLWFAPLIVALAAAAALAVLAARRRSRPVEPDPLTPEERARVDALLAAGGPPDERDRERR